MADTSDTRRDAINDAIAANGSVPNAVLIGWAVVAEWMDHDGERWLSKAHASTTSAWTAKGMYHEALNGEWPAEDD